MGSKLLFIALIAIFAFGTPLIASAHDQAIWKPYWGPLLSCVGNYGGETAPVKTGPEIGNPTGVTEVCRSFCDMIHTFHHIVAFVITIALYVILPISISVGGGMMMLSGGSVEKVTAGRQIITSTIIGVLLIMGAYIIVNTMLYVLNVGRGMTGGPSDLQVQWGNITCSTTPPPAATP